MKSVDDITVKEEFESTRMCDFCNSQEGKIRMVGNFIVELSPVLIDDESKLACQSCKIKERNFRKAQQRQRAHNSFFKNLLKIGF